VRKGVSELEKVDRAISGYLTKDIDAIVRKILK